ncbi:uncharacterized protein LOC124155181 isoform X2 [Ischnura elegans]|nr:uncharacterized protein LOC124155181 isoform X2 [Ischnura elegans]
MYSQITGACVDEDIGTDSSSVSSDTMSQKKKAVSSDSTPGAPTLNHLVFGAVSRKVCPPSNRQSSPAPSSSPKAKERSSETQEHHDLVRNLISSHTPVLILLRGLPGSGKSTLSKQLLSIPGGKSGFTCSADDFFLVPHGGKGQKEYRFDPLKLEDAHKHCRIQVLRAMAHGVTPIIVDNTNTQAWEMLPYVEMALEPWKAEDSLRKMVADGAIAKRNVCSSLSSSRNSLKGKKCNCGLTVMEPAAVPYQVELLEPLTWWYRNPSRLAKVNQHGVSQKKITQMLSHFEYGLTGKDLIMQVLKKKPLKKHTVPAQQHIIPSMPKVKPSKEIKQPSQFAGAPLINRKKPANVKANHLSNHFVHGSNQFQQSVANALPNFVGFPSGPYVQPVLYSPSMFNTGSSGQPISSKTTEAEFMATKEQLHWTPEEKRSMHSSSSNIFPGVQPTNLFSSQESEVNDADGCGWENASSKSDGMGHNPFLQSVNGADCQEVDVSANVRGKGIGMREKEWKEVTASKFMDWKSNEGEESGEKELQESSEPKPARSIWHRHAAVLAAKINEKSSGDPDSQDAEGNDEWITDGIDPLASWNTSSNAQSHKDPDESERKENDGPLPPRSPKKKCAIENESKDTDEAEQIERITNTIEGHEFGWIKDIRLLLKALGLDRDKSDATQVCSNGSESTSKTADVTAGGSEQDCDNSASLSNVPGEMGPVSNGGVAPVSTLSAFDTFGADKEMNDGNSVMDKTQEKVNVESSNADVNMETSDEGLHTSPCLNLLDPPVEVKPTDDEGDPSVTPGRKNEPLIDQVEATEMPTPMPESSGIDASVTVFDSHNCCQSELKSCSSKAGLNGPVDNIFGEVINMACGQGDHGTLKHGDFDENETLDLKQPEKDESCHYSGEKNECIMIHGKTESGKMTVLKSLLLGIEKAQLRRQGEFESSEKCLENAEVRDSKPNANATQLKEGETLPLCEDLSLSDWHFEKFKIDATAAGVTHDLEHKNLPVDDATSILKFVGESERLEEDECSSRRLPQNNSSLVEESEGERFLIKDDDGSTSPPVVSLPSQDSLSPAANTHKESHEETKTDSFVEFNLCKEERKFESFTVVTNEDVIPSCSTYPSSLHHKDDDNSPSIRILYNENKTISDSSIKEESLRSVSTEQTKVEGDVSESPSISLGPNTEQSVFEKTGKFPMDNLGESSQNFCSPGSIYPDLHFQLGKTNISKSDSGIDDFVVADEMQPCIDRSVIEEKDVITCDDDAVTYPLVLDSNFVDLLYGTFGNPFEEPSNESAKLPGGSASGITINIPSSLARKLHECLLKSQWDSILAEEEMSQKMLIEDELLARQLQELEKEDLNDTKEYKQASSNTPNLREIMDMEMAMAMYNADQSKKIMNNQRNDMSTRLTWDLLAKEFPQVPQNVIAQIFAAYDYSYANAREALLTSLPEYERDSHAGGVKEVVSPEAIAAQEKALLEKVKMESLKFQRRGVAVEDDSEEEVDDEYEGSWREMVEEARKSAALNRRLQKERHAQAQAANRSGMASAAAYYCQMATLHKQKAEEASRRAANILSKVFTGRFGNPQGGIGGRRPMVSPPPTLDMHSMKVAEAVTVMNAFLDTHIECLRADQTRLPTDSLRKSIPTKTKTLFLVTGRGLNSLGGIPRIKPAVEKQLEMRGVRYEEMNPGLLRVTISADQPTKRKVG